MGKLNELTQRHEKKLNIIIMIKKQRTESSEREMEQE